MKRTALRSGETLVEVLAAAAVFLLMMGIMQGAISFCTRAQHKGEALRAVNADICEKLRTASWDTSIPDRRAVYSFKAVSADGQHESSGVLFRVEAGLGEKKVEYKDESGTDRTVTFYVFRSVAPALPEDGGGTEP